MLQAACAMLHVESSEAPAFTRLSIGPQGVLRACHEHPYSSYHQTGYCRQCLVAIPVCALFHPAFRGSRPRLSHGSIVNDSSLQRDKR